MAEKDIKMSEGKLSAKLIKESVKGSYKNHKVLWKCGIVAAVFVILIALVVSAIQSEWFVQKAFDIIVPEKIENETDINVNLVFYREKNPDYDPEEEVVDGDNYTMMYNFYYLDSNGEKQYVPDGIYTYMDSTGEEQSIMVALGFVMKAGDRLAKIVTVLKWIAAAIVVAFVAWLIVLWYKKDKQRMLEEKKATRVHKKK